MKVVILAGGFGTRLYEESQYRPKPMIEIGGLPILWHIMKHYYSYGHKDFYIAANAKNKSQQIIDFFLNYRYHRSDLSFDFGNDEIKIINNRYEDWKVNIIETGSKTETAGRIKRLEKYLNNETFLCTYGDGVSNLNIDNLIEFHKSHSMTATLTSSKPASRFGCLKISNDKVQEFVEKPKDGDHVVNTGYFVFEPEIFKYIKNDSDSLTILSEVAKNSQLAAYKHDGFWQCMDTYSDLRILRNLYEKNKAPWILW